MTLDRASKYAIVAGLVLTCVISGAGMVLAAGVNNQRLTVLESKAVGYDKDHDRLITMADQIQWLYDRLGGPSK